MARMTSQDIVHGLTTSQDRLCTDGPDGGKCQVCKDHMWESNHTLYLLRKARLQEDPTIRPHGQENTYKNWGCRCDDCYQAASEAAQKYNHGRPIPLIRPNRDRPLKKGPQRDRATPIGREWCAT